MDSQLTTRIVDKGWAAELSDALAADSSHVRVISPFIKVSAVKNFLTHKPRKLQVITRFNLADFAAGVSDVAALRELTQANAQVRGIKNLHAKLYVFGSTRAIVTSANLTDAGLNRNFELGTVSEDAVLVKNCQRYFNGLWERVGQDLQLHQIDDWDETITKYQLRGGRPNDTADLRDYGADIGLKQATAHDVPSIGNIAGQAFVMLLGNSTQSRKSFSCRVIDVIKSNECHWAFFQKRRNRQVQDGDDIYIGQFTRDPDDIRVFGRATGVKHVDGRDDATQEDIGRIPWRAEFPYYNRVCRAEFVDGSLANGISMKELVGARKKPDTRFAHRGHARVKLAGADHHWLEQRLEEAFEIHEKVSPSELATLYWPDPV